MTKNIENITKCVCGNPMKSGELACSACRKDLDYIIAQRMALPGVNRAAMYKSLIEHAKEHGIGPVGTCAICGNHYIWGGNSPSPMVEDEDARCCSRCNDRVVIPARIKEIIRHHKKTVG